MKLAPDKLPSWLGWSRESARAAAWVSAALLVTGVAAGLLWAAIAPRAAWVRQGNGGYFADSNSKALVAADGWFFFLGIAIGAVAGVLVCRVVRNRGPLPAIALAVGSLGGAYLAAVVGHAVTLADFASTALITPDGKPLDYFLTVRAGSAIFAWPLVAELSLVLYTLLRWPREDGPPMPDQPPMPGPRWPGDVDPPVSQ